MPSSACGWRWARRGLPPLYLHVGSVELQLDDARRFTEAARAQGVRVHLEVWPEMVHNFQVFGEGFPEAVRGTAKLCEHVRGLLPRSGDTAIRSG